MDNTGEIQQSQLTVKEQIHLQKERMASYEQKKGNDPNAKQAEIVKEVGNIRQMSAINKVNGIRSEINIIASEPKPLLLPEEKTTEEKTERATGSANPNILGKVAGSSAGVIMVILKFIQDRLVEYIADAEQSNQRITIQQAIEKAQEPKPLTPIGIGETVQPTQPLYSEQQQLSPPTSEQGARARTFVFGDIQVTEDLHSRLVNPQEQEMYQIGFHTLQALVASTQGLEQERRNIETMVLINPALVSGIVGLQPLLSLHSGEATLLYQTFERSEIDFNSKYSFMEVKKFNRAKNLLLNDRAAELVLKTYQAELGITIDASKPLTKEEIIDNITQLFGSDAQRANLAFGLLSGYPLTDVQYFTQEGDISRLQPHTQIKNPDARFLYPVPFKALRNIIKVDPIAFLDPTSYDITHPMNQYFPDDRSFLPQNSQSGFIAGFGLGWGAPLPPREPTIQHCQKLLEIDRRLQQTDGTLGLLSFVDRQRSTFNTQDNIQLIGEKRASSMQQKIGEITGAVRAIAGRPASK